MEALAREIGSALRRVRRARGLTLRNVATLSGGRFKATSVAGYERGERSITLERFCALCTLYGMPPDRLLADILRAVEGRAEATIDLTALESLGTREGVLVQEFVQQVRAQRRQRVENRIVLRAADVEVLATAVGKEPGELLRTLQPADASEQPSIPPGNGNRD